MDELTSENKEVFELINNISNQLLEENKQAYEQLATLAEDKND